MTSQTDIDRELLLIETTLKNAEAIVIHKYFNECRRIARGGEATLTKLVLKPEYKLLQQWFEERAVRQAVD